MEKTIIILSIFNICLTIFVGWAMVNNNEYFSEQLSKIKKHLSNKQQ